MTQQTYGGGQQTGKLTAQMVQQIAQKMQANALPQSNGMYNMQIGVGGGGVVGVGVGGAAGNPVFNGQPGSWGIDIAAPPSGIESVASRLEELGHAMRAIDIVYGTTPDWTAIREEMAALKLTLVLHGYAVKESISADDPEVRKLLDSSINAKRYELEADAFYKSAMLWLSKTSRATVFWITAYRTSKPARSRSSPGTSSPMFR